MYIMGQLQKINVVAQISDIATKHARTLPCDTALECDSAIEIQNNLLQLSHNIHYVSQEVTEVKTLRRWQLFVSTVRKLGLPHYIVYHYVM